MSFFGQNVKKIRKIKQISQSQFADLFGLTRASIGAYEEGRSEAKIDTILQIAKYFSITVDSLLTKELTVNDLYHFDIVNKDLDRYHHIMENGSISDLTGIPLVSEKIFGEYISKIEEKDFVRRLPKLKLPVKNSETLRAFVQEGNAMQNNDTGILHGDIVIADACLKESFDYTKVYVVVYARGIVIRRFKKEEEGNYIFVAENPDYEELEVVKNEIIETWQVKYIFTKHVTSVIKPYSRLVDLERRLSEVEKKLKE